MIDKADAELLLQGAKYIFAKTMPDRPHFYTLRDSWASGGDFEDVVRFIRANGQKEIFSGRVYAYYRVNGWKYWTMSSAPEKTRLINRARYDSSDHQDGD